jgi:hypothetical protein
MLTVRTLNGVSIGALKLLPDRLTSSRRLQALSPAIEGPLIAVRVILRALGRIYFW